MVVVMVVLVVVLVVVGWSGGVVAGRSWEGLYRRYYLAARNDLRWFRLWFWFDLRFWARFNLGTALARQCGKPPF